MHQKHSVVNIVAFHINKQIFSSFHQCFGQMIFSQVFRADKPFLLTIHVQKCLDIKIDKRENGLDTYLGSNTIYLSYTNIYLILICKNKGSTSFNSILSVYQSIQMRIQWHLFTCSKYSKTFMVAYTLKFTPRKLALLLFIKLMPRHKQFHM